MPMRNVLWKLGIRVNKRILVTVLGIAICMTYLVGVISLVEGLHESTDQLSELFSSEVMMAYNNGTISESVVPASTVNALQGRRAVVLMAPVWIEGERTYLIGIEDPDELLGGDLSPNASSVYLGKALLPAYSRDNVTVSITGMQMQVSFEKRFRSSFFPDHWALGPMELVRELVPSMNGHYSFILLEATADDLVYLRDDGYTVTGTMAIADYLEGSIEQVEGNLWMIIAISFIIIVMLNYSVMSIELLYRKADIRILGQIGASQSKVMSVFLLQTLFITFLGIVLGTSLGFVAANALTSFSPLLGYSTVVVPQATVRSFVYPALVALVSGLGGGAVPIYLSSRMGVRE